MCLRTVVYAQIFGCYATYMLVLFEFEDTESLVSRITWPVGFKKGRLVATQSGSELVF